MRAPRALASSQSRGRRTARFWWAAISLSSGDRRAITSPGSIRRPARPIRLTRTRSGAGASISSLLVQEDGKILAGGHFVLIGGQTRNNIARLIRATGLADSFDPNASNEVHSIAQQADGKILVGGTFTAIGGHRRQNIAVNRDLHPCKPQRCPGRQTVMYNEERPVC